MKRGIFHSYTLEEAEETARMWAGISLLAFGGMVMVGGKLLQAVTWDFEGAAAGGMLNGMGAIAVFAGVWMELRAASRCLKHRKAFKRAHPEMFDSAGDEIAAEAPA